jgi:O-antigen/teichoic acid export membrane protein
LYCIRRTKRASFYLFFYRNTDKTIIYEILNFSLPLLGVSWSIFLIGWTDTIMLGALSTFENVGMYNAAYPLAQFVSYPSTLLVLVFLPIISGLYAQQRYSEMKKIYIIVTKWLSLSTLPMFLILFFYPEVILAEVFGNSYVPASTALRILALTFIISNYLGPNGATLTAIGETRFMMYATLVAALLCILFDYLLIPIIGINGPAVGSLIAISFINIIRTLKLYSLNKTFPFDKTLMIPTAIMILVSVLIFIIMSAIGPTLWIVVLIGLGLYGLCLFIVLKMNFIEPEEITLIQHVEKKFSIPLMWLIKIPIIRK